ncbi:Long-chain-fatty-acid--AMP ligase FadD29 [Rubripirellula amarantea]|uniref:Long-chain-fatty-acid--AMP ligase FadD29 n=1 Tax=Rubripirellula amarantea TaxID=2527999 RepID=A0A5C5WWU5_9BACT|nr:AMP-binding protein [Rubripirellula amarantea]TWT54699.1 Long-chain-fatty-acid--AMP ligase FadD29 [Rubripirellula amarantea]
MPVSDLSPNATLPEWIGNRAMRHGNRLAISFVSDNGTTSSWTYTELWSRACQVAEQLNQLQAASTFDPPSTQTNGAYGDADLGSDSSAKLDHGFQAPRALLLYSPGIEFLAAFLGCQIAGWIPVPTCYPRPGRKVPRLDSAAEDCRPAALLGDATAIEGLEHDLLCDAARNIPHIATDDSSSATSSSHVDPATLDIDPDSLALLQYTSGSTSEPKGVMVRHRNLVANLHAIGYGFRIPMQPDDAEQVEKAVFWLPFFHDMGLIGGILAPLYLGCTTILISPRAFLQRPLRWLQMISDHKASISGAPNFAYQLCVDRISPAQADDLDLSCWKIAFSGAEPVLARTLHDFDARFSSSGFSENSYYPCYGLAEATLLAAGGEGPHKPQVIKVDRQRLGEGDAEVMSQGRGANVRALVSCGLPARNMELLVVDPATLEEKDSRQVGEIWLRGPSVTAGYWNRKAENEERFHAQTADGRSGFCRTGDLGFLHDGELFVTGRLKDMVILRGRNFFPNDIEDTVSETIGSEGGQCVAIAVDGVRSEALAIVAELPRHHKEISLPGLVRSIRRAVIDVHEVDPRHVLLVRQGTVPLTSSGKVKRSHCRQMFDDNSIESKYRYDCASGSTQVPLDMPVVPTGNEPKQRERFLQDTESWMTQWLIARAGVDPRDIDFDKLFAEYGLDSMTAVEMSGEIEDWSGAELTPIDAWNYPTVSKLSAFIVAQVMGDDMDSVPSLQNFNNDDESTLEADDAHAFADKRQS